MARSRAALHAVYSVSIGAQTGASLCRCLIWFGIFFLAVIFAAGTSSAQVSDPVVTALAPTQGAGHHYIGLGAETVNPADGSVSFDLPIPTPPGRQLSFPFGIHYGSTESFTVGNLAGSLLWQGSLTPPSNLNGWSYELPSITGTVAVVQSRPDPNGMGTDYCLGDVNLTFRGFEGVESAPYLANEWPYTPPPANSPLPCYQNQTSPINLTADNGSLLTIVAPLNDSIQQPMNIVDRSGTVYQFPVNYLPSSTNPSAWGLLAQTITDKNGNTITLNGTNYNSSFPSGSYTDTLGRQVVSWTGLGSSTGDQLTVAGLGGNFVVKWETITLTFPAVSHVISSSFGPGCTFNGYPNSFQVQAVSEIDLPNGTKYAFTYGGQYGGLIRITFPQGGYARYEWADNSLSLATYQQYFNQSYNTNVQCYSSYDTPAISDRYVSYDGTTEVLHQQFAYATGWPGNSNPNWSTKSTIVTNTDLRTGQVTSTVYNYGSVVEPGFVCCSLNGIVNQIPVEQSVVYKDGPNGTGNTLKTVNKTWLDRFAMIGEQTILSNGQGSTTLRCYDSTNLNRVLAEYEYGFQNEGAKPADPSCAMLPYGSPSGSTLSYGLNTSAMGPLRRQSATVYHNFGTGDNLLDAPDSVKTYDGSGNTVKQTTYTYTDTVQSSGTGVGLVAPPQAHRGNVATAAKWISGSTWATTSYAYFDNGHLQSMTDPCGNGTCSDMPTGSNHTTTYSYADNPSGNTNAYLTLVTDPLGHTNKYSYNYADGQVTSSTDANNQVTNYKYNTPPAGCSFSDGLDRISEIDYPDTGKTTFCYNDAQYSASTPSPSVTTTKSITSTLNKVSTTAFDGMGHTVETILSSDPDGATYTATTYDGTGKTYQVYNPTRCNPANSNCGEATWGVTTYTYDALGRTNNVSEPDGSAIQTVYDQTCSVSTSGVATTVTDETGRLRQSCSDGLGRLIEVDEPGAGATIGSPSTATVSINENSSQVSNTFNLNPCPPPPTSCSQTAYNSGTITLTVGGTQYSTGYGPPPPTGAFTTSSIASALASQIDGSVTATANGSTITLTATTTGADTDYSLSTTASYASSELCPSSPCFSGPSFYASAPSSMTGGADSGLGSSPLVTDYSYDPLNNLLSVTQKGGSSNSSNWRPRSFVYDALSRLTSASNPESGTITYSYDLNGNLTTRVVPKANQTGTALTTHTYAYDVLNRLVKESHLDPNQGTELYSYDGIALTGCTGPAPPKINSPTNLIGRRTGMCAGLSSSTLSYDAMGRSVFEATANKGSSAKTYIVGYTYYLDGSLKTLAYPSGDVVTYTVGGAGRTTQVADSANTFVAPPTNSPTMYAPHGALAGMTNGTGIVTSNAYNDRLQPFMLSAGVGQSAIFSLCYDFHLRVTISNSTCGSLPAYTTGDNGNVFQVLNQVDSTRSTVFAYDLLNRIAQANTVNTTSSNCWGETYTIDGWGNLTNRAIPSGMAGNCITEGLSATATTNNQLSGIGMTYDAAGNVTKDNLGNMYTYDAENRVSTVAGYTYNYDADGARMEKAAGSTGTMYWMGPAGALTETDLTGAINEEYIFFNGQRIARVDQPTKTVHYYFSDHLGSTSVITDALGNVVKRDFYFPYGAEQSTSTGSDPNHYKFTGKERDSESSLDNFTARYYASSIGRFMIPDWSSRPSPVPYASVADPQSLNLYSYVQNNPLRYVDPDGHCDNWFCRLGQRFDNLFHGVGFHTNKQVEDILHNYNQLIRQNGLKPEGLKEKQVYKLGVALAATTRPSAAQARAIWEKATGQKVPFDPESGRFYDMAHKQAIADGGNPRDPNNLKPQLHSEHMEEHMENGDFARWGARANQTQTPTEPTVGEQLENKLNAQRPIDEINDDPNGGPGPD